MIAAGNDGVDLDNPRNTESPDGYGLSNTLTVANFTTRNTLAADSNYGARHVQIASLGTVLWGDYPRNATGGYLGGSSAAAAATSGVAALLFAADPAATAAQVGGRSSPAQIRRSRRCKEGRGERAPVRHRSARGARTARNDAAVGVQSRRPSRAFRYARYGAGQVRVAGGRATRSSRATPLTVDGRTTNVPPGQTELRAALRPGTIAGACPHTTSRATEPSRPARRRSLSLNFEGLASRRSRSASSNRIASSRRRSASPVAGQPLQRRDPAER